MISGRGVTVKHFFASIKKKLSFFKAPICRERKHTRLDIIYRQTSYFFNNSFSERSYYFHKFFWQKP